MPFCGGRIEVYGIEEDLMPRILSRVPNPVRIKRKEKS